MTKQDSIFAPKIVHKGEGRKIDFPLHPVFQTVAGKDMASNLSIVETTIAPKTAGAPPHYHTYEDEIYYVLEGEITFLMGDRVETAGPGATVILPRHIMHGTWNAGDVQARALTVISQDSPFEKFFDHVAARAAQEDDITPMRAAQIVGEESAKIGVVVNMEALPPEAHPYFGMG